MFLRQFQRNRSIIWTKHSFFVTNGNDANTRKGSKGKGTKKSDIGAYPDIGFYLFKFYYLLACIHHPLTLDKLAKLRSDDVNTSIIRQNHQGSTTPSRHFRYLPAINSIYLNMSRSLLNQIHTNTYKHLACHTLNTDGISCGYFIIINSYLLKIRRHFIQVYSKTLVVFTGLCN